MAAKLDIIVGAQTGQARQELEGFIKWLKAGLGMDLARRMTDMLMRIPQAVAAAVNRGVQFNSMLEDTQIAMAALLRQLEPKAFGNFGLAMDGARKLIAGLRQEALTTKATFGELVGATQGLIGPALSAGISVERIPALASMISRAVSTVMPGAPAFQTMQEGRALLTGQIGPDAQLAKNLGINRDMITQARAQGRLFEMLAEKMGAFNEAAELSMGTLSGLVSNLSDAFDEAMAEATQDLYQKTKEFVGQIKEMIAGEEFKSAVREFGKSLLNLTDGLMRLAVGLEPIFRWINRFLGGIPDTVGAAGAALDRGESLTSAVHAAGRALAEHRIRQLGSDLAEAMTPHGQTSSDSASGSQTSRRPSAPRLQLLAPDRNSDTRSGLWLTRAQAVVAATSLEVQRRMLDQLSTIAQALTQRGIKVAALDIPV